MFLWDEQLLSASGEFERPLCLTVHKLIVHTAAHRSVGQVAGRTNAFLSRHDTVLKDAEQRRGYRDKTGLEHVLGTNLRIFHYHYCWLQESVV